jgi:hypothetical protein
MTRVGEVALVGVGWSAGAVWWGAYQLTPHSIKFCGNIVSSPQLP